MAYPPFLAFFIQSNNVNLYWKKLVKVKTEEMMLTRRSSFVDKSLAGQAQDLATSASALLSPTLPVKENYIDYQISASLGIQ